MARAASKVPSASLTIWLCHGISQFTRIRGTDPWHECSPGEHASRVHHGPFPLHSRGLHRIEPGTLTREAAAHHATTPGLLGWTRVALEPFLPRLADVPGGLVPDATRARWPWAAPYVARQASKVPVTALTGRPWTQRHRLWWVVGPESPSPALAWPAGSWAGPVGATRRTGAPALQAGIWGGASRRHSTAASQPRARSGWGPASRISRARGLC
jgi:hypothetical protein